MPTYKGRARGELSAMVIIVGNGIRDQSSNLGGGPHGVMVKAMDCGIVVREFILQSHYYIHFRANTLGKGINPLILPAMG